jgi:hypothetical protein
VQAATWALEPVARQRQQEIRREAVRCRGRARRPDPQRWRVRLGWALVEVGLRLAVERGSGTALPTAPGG